MNHRVLFFLLVSSLVAACSSAPKDPSWNEDILPIVVANCLRCHASPALDGAPTDFRLDRYSDTQLSDGRVIRGAATMAQFMSARAGIEGTMPPDFDRAVHQRDAFVNWFDARINHGNMPRPGRSEGNREPKAKLLVPISAADQSPVTVSYEISDPDGDLVSGVLLLGDRTIADNVQSGRGEITFDPSVFPPGSHQLTAQISDDIANVSRTLATIEVAHADGNTAPRLRFQSLLRDQLFHDADGDLSLTFEVSDPDVADTFTLSLLVFRGSEEISIETALPASLGSQDYTWNVASIPEGTGWRLRAEISDGTSSSILESGRFTVSHATTDLTFSDVEDIFSQSCGSCHPRAGIPALPFSLTVQDPPEGFYQTVNSLRGLIYRRVVLESNMPPQSSQTIAEQNDDTWTELSAADRNRIEEYLLGGSPQ